MRALLDHLAEQREVLRAAVERVPVAMRERRPAPDRWSAAEVLEHLGIVEGRLTAMLSKVVESAPQRAAPPAEERVIDRGFLKHLANRNIKIESRDTSRPSGGLDAAAAWAVLQSTRSGLLAVVHAAENVDLSAFKHPHPIFGPLDVFEWLVFVGGHEARHAAQIEEIGETLSASRESK